MAVFELTDKKHFLNLFLTFLIVIILPKYFTLNNFQVICCYFKFLFWCGFHGVQFLFWSLKYYYLLCFLLLQIP